MDKETRKVRTPWFPLYSEVRRLLGIYEGTQKAVIVSLHNALMEQTGTPQSPVDWTEPDSWIDQRLSGEEATLARRIWEESDRKVNPRHTHGAYLFVNAHKLIVPNGFGVYQLANRGRAFLDEDDVITREIDEAEGLPQLLGILAPKNRAKRGELVDEWGDYLREHSNFRAKATIEDTLRRRLANLSERSLVTREGYTYSITPQGMQYAAGVGNGFPADSEADAKLRVLSAVRGFNTEQREKLQKQLSVMSPYRFEHLVGDLLEAMGYEDVMVTKASGDKGVDVVATVQFGITTIREVVQVKRQQGNVGRQVLDQLRGVLPFHGAIRGTIITTGGFAKKCAESALFPGAAPIGLINGEKLLDLLIEHKIGIYEQRVVIYEVDDEIFLDGDPIDPDI